MPTESTTFSSYSSHSYENQISLYESIFKGDIAPLNFRNLRITGFLERPSLNLSKVLSNLIPIRDKKTLDNEWKILMKYLWG